jgi:putative Mg2+ transporter-C (MgtC) family protein
MMSFDLYPALQPMLGITLATALSLIIGLEREFYAKAAGMRTYTLVGMGAAVFTAVSKYGFQDVVLNDFTRTDGSRVAAQVVTGIGFLGAGLIFVRKDSVRGLTTGAGIWFVSAVGMTAAAGMYLIACLITILYLLVMIGLRPLTLRLPHSKATRRRMTVQYADGRGILRDVMETISGLGLKVVDLTVVGQKEEGDVTLQQINIEVEGPAGGLSDLGDQLYELSGVYSVDSAQTAAPDR